MDKRMLTKEEIRAVQMAIMREIDGICRKNGWTYQVMYGTLLGAVRHRGFIPWDDDIDIVLRRREYDRLVAYIKSEENTCPWLRVLDSSVPGYYYPFAKAVDKRTVAKMAGNTTVHGVWVDVFPQENLPDNLWKANLMLDVCYLLREVTLAMTTDFASPGRRRQNEGRKRLLHAAACVIGKKNICRLYEALAQRYKDKETSYIGTAFSPYRRRERFKKEWFAKCERYPFEDAAWTGPAAYDEILRQLYGDYWQLPPPEKRRTHQIDAWYL